jgi:hypothetical protein
VFNEGVVKPNKHDAARLKETVIDPVLRLLGDILPETAREQMYWPTMQTTRYGEVCV